MRERIQGIMLLYLATALAVGCAPKSHLTAVDPREWEQPLAWPDHELDIHHVSLQSVIDDLSSPDQNKRYEAASQIRMRGDTRVIPELLCLARSGDEYGRQGAGLALTSLGAVRALPVFLEMLHDSSPNVRIVAIRGLSNLRNSASCRPLASLLADPEPEVRDAAEEAITAIGGTSAATAVSGLYESGGRDVRERILRAMSEISRRIDEQAARLAPSEQPERISPSVMWVRQQLAEGTREEREDALAELHHIESPEATAVLIDLLADPEERFRKRAALFLRERASSKLTEELLAAFRAANPYDLEHRGAIIEALGPSAHPGVVGFLMDLLSDVMLRVEVTRALGRATAVESVELLIATLEDPLRNEDVEGEPVEMVAQLCESIRLAVVEALERIGDRRATEALVIAALADKSMKVRNASIRAIGTFRERSAAEALIGLLKNRGLDESAASSLVAIGQEHPDVMSLVRPHLETSQPRGGLILAVWLAQNGDAEAWHFFENRIHHPGWAPVICDRLGELPSPEARRLLRLMCQDVHWYVRKAAITALGKIGTPEDRKIIAGGLSDPTLMVRWAAAGAMAVISRAQEEAAEL